MKQQTAVEWLIDFIETNIEPSALKINAPDTLDYWGNAKHEAMVMEKEQIEESFYQGECNCTNCYDNTLNSEQYYQQTYGGDK